MAITEAGIKLIAEGVDSYVSAINKANNATQNFANDTANTKGAFDGWSSMVRGAFEKVGGLVTEQLFNAGQAMIGFVADAPALAGDFEAGMNRFGAAASIPAESIGEFEDLFITLGKELPVSTMETVDAATALVKGGIDPAVVAAGGLRDTLNFASAAGLGLEQSANIVAKQLGQFVPVSATAAEKTEFMARSMDLMTKAAGASTLDVDDLADGMAEAGGVANAIGLSYEDLVTTMGAISPAFGSASEAGNSLKNMLTRLQPTSKASFEAMQELGLIAPDTGAMMDFLAQSGVKPLGSDFETLDGQIRDYLKTQKGLKDSEIESAMSNLTSNAFFANGELLDMQEIVGVLETATKDLTDEQKINYLQTIFGAEAMNTVVSLSEMGVEGFDAFAAAMDKANGVTEQAEAVNKGYNFAMTNLSGSLEAFQLTIGGPMRDAMAPYILMLNDAVGVAMTFAEALMGNKESFAALPGPIQEIINYFGSLSSTTDNLMMIYYELMWQLQPVFDAIKANFMAVGGLLVDFFTGESFNMILGAVMNIVFGVTEILAHMATVIQPIIQRATEIIGVMLDSLGPIVDAIVNTFASPVVISAINSIVSLLGAVVSLGLELVLLAWNDLVNDFNALWPTIDWVIQAIGTVISTVLPFVTAIIEGLVNYLRGDTTNAFSTLETLVAETWDNIVTSISGAIEEAIISVGKFIADIQKEFDSILSAAKQYGVDLIQGFIDGISSMVSKVLSKVGSLIEDVKKKFNVGFDFGSPSKVTTEMGEWIGEGLSIGMDKSVYDVLKSSNDLVMAARSPIMQLGQGMTQSVVNNYTLGVNTTASPTVIMRSYDLMRGTV